MDYILKLVAKIFGWLAEFLEPEVPLYEEPMEEEKLLLIAEKYLGTDASPDDAAPDFLGCADSLSLILKEYTNDFPHTLSTITLKELLDASPYFERTLNWKPGYVVVFPTEGQNRGHCWILGKNSQAMSNNSYNGKWEYNYGWYDIINKFWVEKRLVGTVYKPIEVSN